PAGQDPGGGERRHPSRGGGDEDLDAGRLSRGTLEHAAVVLARLLEFSAPADETLSRYFRGEPALGRQERGFIAEAAFAVLRRRRSLEPAAGTAAPEALLAAAAIKVLGLSLRALEGLVEPRLA